jgi:ADP-heptose:LPS heptosyltransferase
MHRSRVLLIRLSSLGDLVILTSTLSLLEKAGAEVHLLTKREYFPLFEGDPRIRRLIPFERGLRGILRTAVDLRMMQFDVAFDLHVKAATLLLLALSGVKQKARYRKRALLRRRAIRRHQSIEEIPVSHLYAEPVTRLLDLEADVPPPKVLRFERPPVEIKKPYVVLVPGGKSQTKRWPETHYRELARKLRTLGLRIVLAGDAGDTALCTKVAEGVEKTVNLCGKTDLLELAGLLKEAEFVVANDSGPAHLAAALRTPLYVFFGPTHPSFGFRPQGSRVRLFEQEMDCRPCALHGEDRCRFEENRCLTEIDPKEVLEVIAEDIQEVGERGS